MRNLWFTLQKKSRVLTGLPLFLLFSHFFVTLYLLVFMLVVLWFCLMFHFYVFHLLVGLSCASNSLLPAWVGDFSSFILRLGIQSCLRLYLRCFVTMSSSLLVVHRWEYHLWNSHWWHTSKGETNMWTAEVRWPLVKPSALGMEEVVWQLEISHSGCLPLQDQDVCFNSCFFWSFQKD